MNVCQCLSAALCFCGSLSGVPGLLRFLRGVFLVFEPLLCSALLFSALVGSVRSLEVDVTGRESSGQDTTR